MAEEEFSFSRAGVLTKCPIARCTLVKEEGCYVYTRRDNCKFSSMKVTPFVKLGFLTSSDVTSGYVPLCSCSEASHHHLIPFLYSNDGILRLYHSEGLQEKANELLSTISTLQREKPFASHLPSEAKYYPLDEIGTCFTEDEWTARLANALIDSDYANEFNVFSSSLSGVGTSMKNFLKGGLNLPKSFQKAFLFAGSPDLLIGQKFVILCSSQYTDDEASNASDENEMALENSLQRSPLGPDEELGLPQKLGQLIAIQHTVLAGKVLKKFKSGGEVEQEYRVNGILIDKIGGTMESSMTVTIKKSVMCPVRVEICRYGFGVLSARELCSHFQSLLQRL